MKDRALIVIKRLNDLSWYIICHIFYGYIKSLLWLSILMKNGMLVVGLLWQEH